MKLATFFLAVAATVQGLVHWGVTVTLSYNLCDIRL